MLRVWVEVSLTSLVAEVGAYGPFIGLPTLVVAHVEFFHYGCSGKNALCSSD